jgi:hypothetical protein
MVTEPAPNPSLAPPHREGLDAARLLAAAAVFLALAYFGAVLLATGGSPGSSLRATAIAVVPSVLLALVALRAGRRARWFDGGRLRLAILHVAFALLYAACWSISVIVLFAAERWLVVDGARFQIRIEFFGWSFFTGLLLYGGVAGAAFGVEASARLRAERARLARAETLRARAELAALRAQLNPHFLFNTLHTVLGLVRRDPTWATSSATRWTSRAAATASRCATSCSSSSATSPSSACASAIACGSRKRSRPPRCPAASQPSPSSRSSRTPSAMPSPPELKAAA